MYGPGRERPHKRSDSLDSCEVGLGLNVRRNIL